ncbi:chromate efflux transporter [Magnetospirillum sp. UT-4]|uniref:chromate efflux transporter n=1 Tax=Magnetospirillum sp. UT-4 TaxID=2681467 RepID=UPI001382D4E6|nr:chromate efflux transporter [Magnetospirillum sp. UT-4]CAA7613984.1 Chromate transporter [Magnetospirillum sp. UT-4]
MAEDSPLPAPTFAEVVRAFARIGLLSFGGPAGQIATMHRILVDEKKWVDEERFLHALNYCMLLPGPEAQQLATYVGWLLHRVAGGIVAGVLFVLPGFLVMMGLAALYAGLNDVTLVQGLFWGLKPAVLAVVVEATLRIGRRALKGPPAVALAAAAFVAIFALGVPFPLIVAGAGMLGYGLTRAGSAAFAPTTPVAVTEHGVRPSLSRTALVALICGILWLAPVAAALAWGEGAFAALGVFFSKMAVVTFGGAYSVLAYVAQEAVEVHGWVTPGEMLDGLGLAETTPGPLILVNQFVGFLAGFRDPGPLGSWTGGVLAAALTVWVTFLPSFLWIFAGAPHIEAVRGNRALAGALAAITAAVVGVVLNLALWFALHVVFARIGDGPLNLPLPDWSSIQVVPAILAVAAMVAMLRLHMGMLPVLAASAAIGAAAKLMF